ncbi:hypothetical protein [Maribacter sp. 2210JD10-5]
MKTKYVFIENDQVFLKKENQCTSSYETEEWYPIHFQWIPIMELQKE